MGSYFFRKTAGPPRERRRTTTALSLFLFRSSLFLLTFYTGGRRKRCFDMNCSAVHCSRYDTLTISINRCIDLVMAVKDGYDGSGSSDHQLVFCTPSIVLGCSRLSISVPATTTTNTTKTVLPPSISTTAPTPDIVMHERR
jgi:hypothetical protein